MFARCVEAMTAQSLCEWLTNDCSSLRPMSCEGAPAGHCLMARSGNWIAQPPRAEIDMNCKKFYEMILYDILSYS